MRKIFMAFIISITFSLFLMRPAVSYADWNNQGTGANSHASANSHSSGHGNSSGSGNSGHGHDGHDHDGGRSYIGVDLSVWPDNYYYSAPYYPTDDSVLVAAPMYQPVVVNGTTYYMNNGVYYSYNGYGYQAVTPPVTVIEPPTVIVNQAQAAGPVITPAAGISDTSDTFTINIPNSKGGYTAVTLKKSKGGYIGPQGEFYPDFPKVSQLEVIYGKQ